MKQMNGTNHMTVLSNGKKVNLEILEFKNPLVSKFLDFYHLVAVMDENDLVKHPFILMIPCKDVGRAHEKLIHFTECTHVHLHRDQRLYSYVCDELGFLTSIRDYDKIVVNGINDRRVVDNIFFGCSCVEEAGMKIDLMTDV